MRAKTVDTLRKWKRDALEVKWEAEQHYSVSDSRIKLVCDRLAELVEELLDREITASLARAAKKEG